MTGKQLLYEFGDKKRRQTLQRLMPLLQNNTNLEVSKKAHLCYCYNKLMKGGEKIKKY